MRHVARLLGWIAFTALVGGAGAEVAIRVFDLFAPERERTRQERPAGRPDSAASWALVHPYQGFSMRPGAAFEVAYLDFLERALPEGEKLRREDSQRNLFGFRSRIRDYRDVPESDFAVGIFGGSMAEHVAVLGGDVLAATLARLSPRLGRVRVLNFATGAYKQPQPLAVLAQALLLGVHLDAVVEIDGYNEVVFGATDAVSNHHPLFPSRFHIDALAQIASGSPSEALQRSRAEVMRHHDAAEGWRQRTAESRLGASELARAIGGWAIGRHLARAAAAEKAIQDAPSAATPLLASLPDPCLRSGDCGELVVDLWARASLLMAQLSRGSGLRYLHVLQPNQYVAGSKTFTALEGERLQPDHAWARAARAGYPALIARGRALREQGVAFVDATTIFRDDPDTRYVDECCHVDATGNRELARLVAESLVAQLAEPPSP